MSLSYDPARGNPGTSGVRSNASYTEYVKEDCPVCGHRGWCRKADDGSVILCRRQAEGAAFTRTDKNGAAFHVHALVNSYDRDEAAPVKPLARATGPRPDAAPIEVLDEVYGAMLDALTLGSHHREELKLRGLTDDWIERGRYRTLPNGAAPKLAALLAERFGRDVLLTVPGFILDGKGGLNMSCMPGLLIPVDDGGRTVAMRVKPDKRLDGGPKYLWVSSSGHGGPSSGSHCHVSAAPTPEDPTLVRLTEGELKAATSACLSDLTTVSVPGVSNWRLALPVLAGMGCRTVRVAFDMDATTNALVALATVGCCQALAAEGYTVEVERWAWSDGKGIDDVLAAGKPVEVLSGDDVTTYLAELMDGHDFPAGSGANGHAPSNGQADEDDDESEVVDRWPKLDPHAFHGIVGEIVRKIEPFTEADPVAILIQFLVAFGNLVGRSPYSVVNATRHYLNLFCVLVGATAVGRKGTSWDIVKLVLGPCDYLWLDNCVKGGLVSGEGLIHHVRDATEKNGEVVDEGVPDKRCLVVENEFSRTLKAMNRENNTLGDVIRLAYDSGNLSTMSRNNPAKATGAHVSIIAHTTEADIRRHLAETDILNGFANRKLWPVIRRTKVIADPVDLETWDWTEYQRDIVDRADHARVVGKMVRNPDAQEMWSAVYPELSAGQPGQLGSILSRAVSQVLRLADVYALFDGKRTVGPDHLVAALALWKFNEDSVRLLFGDALGDPVADKLLAAIKAAPDGLTRKDIYTKVFGKRKRSQEIVRLLSDLLTHGLIRRENDPDTGGRPSERWFIGL